MNAVPAHRSLFSPHHLQQSESVLQDEQRLRHSLLPISMADPFPLGLSLLEAEDVRGAVLQEVHAAALCQLKVVSAAWCTHARRELCTRLCRYEGASITDLDVECLNNAGRPWEVVVAGRQLPQLARLRGYGFVVDVQAVREADLHIDHWRCQWHEDYDASLGAHPKRLGGAALRSCIQREEDALGQVHDFAAEELMGGEEQQEEEDEGEEEEEEEEEEEGVLPLSEEEDGEEGGEGESDESEEDPPRELLLAAVACAASGLVRRVPVQRLREDDAIGSLNLASLGSLSAIGAARLLAIMLPATTSVRSLRCPSDITHLCCPLSAPAYS